MSSGSKKTKRKKEVKKEVIKEVPPQVVTCTLADNTYCGIIREGPLGEQLLECTDAKYTWSTGITYEGPFVASRIEGRGRYSWPDGSSYDGELQNGKRHGQGVYTSADGLTRYVGQWCMGKRSGNGRLDYNPDGTSYYDGCWKDGKKHGVGKQVWPSGNIYEGEWVEGKMRGEGTMVWRTPGGSEQYTGHWESNEPHGEGQHTWHSTDVSAAVASAGECGKPMPFNPQQQQLNNRYEGQFIKGRREGYGTFYYANGACYRGEWKDHMKHGVGRHTFEDGTVYEGPFEEDQMLEYRKPPPAEGAELIARSMDLSDFDSLALPSDRSGFGISAGAGYTDHSKIFREVYNMLLRHLGELRDLYARYRAAIPRRDFDPFALQSYQFWLFLRDAGLLTPACSLVRCNRAVFSGARFQGEVAPEDLQEVRPFAAAELKERRVSMLTGEGVVFDVPPPASDQSAAAAAAAQEAAASDTRPQSSEATSQASWTEDASSNGSESELPSPSNAAGPSEGGSRPGSAGGATEAVTPADGSPSSPNRPASSRPGTSGASGAGGVGLAALGSLPLGPRFERTDSSAGVANIHSDTRQLLFRQFLEGIVRLAHARFPHERGLEAQIQRLFKENVLPSVEPQSGSEHLFAFLAERNFVKVIEEFSTDLWDIFRRPSNIPDAVREGFGKARRSLHVSARQDDAIRVKDVLRLLDACGLLRRVPPTAEEAASAGLEESSLAMDDGEGSADENASGGSTGGEKAAQDVVAGFLDDARLVGRGMSSQGMTGTADFGFMKGVALPDASGEIGVPGGAHRSSKKRDKGSKEGGSSAPSAAPPPPPASTTGFGAAAAAAVAGEVARCDFSLTPLQVLRLLGETLAPSCLKASCPEVGGLDPLEAAAALAPAAAVGLASSQPVVAAAAAAALAGSRPLSPSAREAQEANAVTVAHLRSVECEFPMLEYVEMEVAFAEFVRLLIQMADQGTKRNPLADQLPLAGRFRAFLEHVFVPALRARYQVPEPIPESPEDEATSAGAAGGDAQRSQGQGEDGAEGGEAAGEAEDAATAAAAAAASEPAPPAPAAGEEAPAADAAEADAGGDGSGSAGGAEEEDKFSQSQLDLWLGFDAEPPAPPREAKAAADVAAAAARGLRCVPQGYEDEVFDW